MLLSRVIVSPDTFYTCQSHALSTEHQEIMGLLLGSLINNNTEAFVKRSMVLSRKDKKKDRVEVSYADLGLASTVAEDLSLRVVGWYHSHPHITVLPSHVDVKTQGQYQALGDFLGLIFSVFDKGQLEMCAFQSRQNRNGDWERVEIPVIVGDASGLISSGLQSEGRLFESLIAMQMVLMNEEKETFETSSLSSNSDGYSPLNISRSLSVYQSSLFQLIDLQICPLLMAMRSKVATLEYERSRLLRELKQINKESEALAAHTEMKSGKLVLDESREESNKALNALEITIPKRTRSTRALQIAFAGITAEIISVDEDKACKSGVVTSIRKGDHYLLKVKRLEVSLSSTSSSPWALEFESDETETEDDTKKSPIKAALLAIHPSLQSNFVDFTILVPRRSVGLESYAKMKVTVRVLSCQDKDRTSDRMCAMLFGETLHNSLHLHLVQS